MDHILSYQTILKKILKGSPIPSPFPDQDGIEFEIDNKKIAEKSLNIWKPNNTVK